MRTIITFIRMVIGWHFLYEGLIKLLADNWSAESFLNNAQGFLSGFYHWLAISPKCLTVIDFLNVWGLILIGLAQSLGVLTRWVSFGGAVLLTLYYFAYPPFGSSLLTSDNTVYIVNQQLIEIGILIFLIFSKEQGYGIDNVIKYLNNLRKERKKPADPTTENDIRQRRELLKNLAVLPVLGVTGWSAHSSSSLSAPDALSGSTIKVNRANLSELKGELPKGKLGNHEISRMILGGNMFDGTAHARDLLYVSSLFKSYNTEKKVFETLMLAEQAGINCVAVSDWVVHSKILNRYKKLTGSKIKVHNYYIFDEDSKKKRRGIEESHRLGRGYYSGPWYHRRQDGS